MLGAIADDFTGATDLATMLRRSGHRVTVVIEDSELSPKQLAAVDAVVVAQKTRTASRADAVACALGACSRLLRWGAERIYVKYCSTFDSTDRGNIGPVLDAVADELGVRHCIVVPALPANGRTVYNGHLFVGSDLLENSSMRHHPLTPMTRSRVAELLRPQTRHDVDEVHHDVIRQGVDRVAQAIEGTDARYIVVDAVADADLGIIAAASAHHRLVSGGSGLALGIKGPGLGDSAWDAPREGRGVILCGSVSAATRGQIAHAALSQPLRRIDVSEAVTDPETAAHELVAWVLEQDPGSTPVVCAARDLSDVVSAHDGVEVAPAIERVLARVARGLVSSGEIRGLIVAGGESSGAVVRELTVSSLLIGPELAPGVCWAVADTDTARVALALKSGNFGAMDLFTTAWGALP